MDMNSQKPAPSNLVVIDALRHSPAVKQAVADRAAQVVSDRQALLAQLREVEDGAPARRYLAAVKRTEQLAAAAEKALEAHRAAVREYEAAYDERMTASRAIHASRQAIVAQLEAGADKEAIDAFIRDMRELMRIARLSVDSREIVTDNAVTGKRSYRTESNAKAVAERVLAINEAINEAEALRHEPDQAIVPTQLAALRAALPAEAPPLVAVAGKP